MFLGGPSLNKAVVAAFEQVTGQTLVVPKHREVMGAFGAALIAKDRMQRAPYVSNFRGASEIVQDRLTHEERICRVDPNCHNQCKLKVYTFSGRKSVWGGECGRYEASRSDRRKEENYFDLRNRIFLDHLEPSAVRLKTGTPRPVRSGAPTVGIQQALTFYSLGVFWTHFFKHLGCSVLLTPPTDYRISRSGIEATNTETCYPVKVSHGHVKHLAEHADFLFPAQHDQHEDATSRRGGLPVPFGGVKSLYGQERPGTKRPQNPLSHGGAAPRGFTSRGGPPSKSRRQARMQPGTG